MLIKLLLNVLGRLLANELSAWTPRLVDVLLRHHARCLPPDIETRFLEEWRSTVHDVPGTVWKLVFALSLFRARGRLWQEALPAFRRKPVTDFVLRTLELTFGVSAVLAAFPFFVLLALLASVSRARLRWVPQTIHGRFGRTVRVWHLAADGWLGAFLRRTDLDVLPVMLSVVTGDLALVGRSRRHCHLHCRPEVLALRPGVVSVGLARMFAPGRSNEAADQLPSDVEWLEQRSVGKWLKVTTITVLGGLSLLTAGGSAPVTSTDSPAPRPPSAPAP